MTLSILKGTHGYQRSEVSRLIDWLAEEVKPEVILLTNVLLSGIIPELQRRLNVPVYTTLQGDDIFLEELPVEAKTEAIQLIRQNCTSVSGHLATCRYYADFMSGYLGLPRERMRVVYPGIELHHFATGAKADDRQVLNIGYLARIAPEKGFHILVEALSKLHLMPDIPKWQFQAAGYCAGYRKEYLEENRTKAQQAGWGDRFTYVGEPDQAGKANFLQNLDIFSVPTIYQEPKGLYVLEAWACGVPVVQPAHGSFPELIEATQGGLLVEPNNTTALAEGLAKLLRNASLRKQLGEAGRQGVHTKFSAEEMARTTLAAMSS